MSSTPLTGFILHRRPYRETSFLLDIFSLEWGKFSAVGKGIRGAKNDKKSLLQPFQALQLTVVGKHELKNLQQVEALAPSLNLQGNYLFSAMYINEIVNRLLAHDIAQPELFTLYQSTLGALANEEPIEPVLRQFELSLLADLGYGIDFSQDAEFSQNIEPEAYYGFVYEHGWLRQKVPSQSRFCFKGETLLLVAQLEWTAASLHCAKQIARLCLAQLLGTKPLKSRELFKHSWSHNAPSQLENGT
ncbi:DNA repair protein RecO [Paraglaciecola hydrolytica]|uniref:DNA repair protein RecO n=1 Tax=Paraglaciecola hydrolytica TaxID=1799789 RepID=A0A148KM33_9ALTE|nr:DNA repair protein RecO [Paraglaciecola hydrolytica]KXI27384.1 DNA repair protein RecO [Paraglaciecola hydrolytica]